MIIIDSRLINFTQGVGDNADAILKDGRHVTPDEIVEMLNSLAVLVLLKQTKKENIERYKIRKEEAWSDAERSLVYAGV